MEFLALPSRWLDFGSDRFGTSRPLLEQIPTALRSLRCARLRSFRDVADGGERTTACQCFDLTDERTHEKRFGAVLKAG